MELHIQLYDKHIIELTYFNFHEIQKTKDLTLLNDSKYSGGLFKAVKAASWKGAGAESVTLT